MHNYICTRTVAPVVWSVLGSMKSLPTRVVVWQLRMALFGTCMVIDKYCTHCIMHWFIYTYVPLLMVCIVDGDVSSQDHWLWCCKTWGMPNAFCHCGSAHYGEWHCNGSTMHHQDPAPLQPMDRSVERRKNDNKHTILIYTGAHNKE